MQPAEVRCGKSDLTIRDPKWRMGCLISWEGVKSYRGGGQLNLPGQDKYLSQHELPSS